MAEQKPTLQELAAKARREVREYYAHPAFAINHPEQSPHYQETIKRAPIIHCDYGKCPNALTCLKCLQICPNRVLCIMPVYADDEPDQRMEPPDKEHGVQVWARGLDTPSPEATPRRVTPFMPELCAYPGCRQCIDACPAGALSIDVSHL